MQDLPISNAEDPMFQRIFTQHSTPLLFELLNDLNLLERSDTPESIVGESIDWDDMLISINSPQQRVQLHLNRDVELNASARAITHTIKFRAKTKVLTAIKH